MMLDVMGRVAYLLTSKPFILVVWARGWADAVTSTPDVNQPKDASPRGINTPIMEAHINQYIYLKPR